MTKARDFLCCSTRSPEDRNAPYIVLADEVRQPRMLKLVVERQKQERVQTAAVRRSYRRREVRHSGSQLPEILQPRQNVPNDRRRDAKLACDRLYPNCGRSELPKVLKRLLVVFACDGLCGAN